MPKVKIHKARTDIYDRGIRIPDEKTKSGFRKDFSQPHPEGDTIFCAKGESYYSWGMMMGGRGVQHKSRTAPRRSQLTNSDFLSTIYDLEDGADFNLYTVEDMQSERDRLVEELNSLGDEQDDKYSNMPEGFQQSSNGEMIQARGEACRAIADEFEGVDLDDFDDEIDTTDIEEMMDQVREEEKLEEDAEIEQDHPRLVELMDEAKDGKLAEWCAEKRDELGGVSWDYE